MSNDDNKLTKEQLEWIDNQIYENDHSTPALDFFRNNKHQFKDKELEKCFEKLVDYLNLYKIYEYLKRKFG